MNFSLTADKTAADVALQSLSHEDLLERFVALKRQYDSTCKQHEDSRQELHEAKKSLQFSAELRDHLAAEVEAWQRNEARTKRDFEERARRMQDEIEALRHEKASALEAYADRLDALQSKLTALEQCDGNNGTLLDERSVTQANSTKYYEDLKRHEAENEELRATVDAQKRELTECGDAIEMFKGQIANLEERLESAKSNLESKKNELASATELLHSVQEDLCLANAELRQFKTAANPHAAKGNSLFAEVDDKRQEMLKSYSQMKDKVHQLNRELLSKQAEIDSLLCEKKTLWDEYAGQSSFHDAVLNRAFERRITDLEKQNYQLQREIASWYEKNLDTSASEITRWVSGVLDYYRDENHRLSNEFSASSVDNLLKEQKLRDLQRQLVAWRTKAMEANATISELETRIQTTEVQSQLDDNDSRKPAPMEKHQNNLSRIAERTLEYSMRKSSVEDKENVSLRPIENLSPDIGKEPVGKPGILVTGSTKSKTVKKATFA